MHQRPLALALIASHVLHTVAQVPAVPFHDCSDPSSSPLTRFNVSTIYAQITNTNILNITLLAQSPSQILDLSNATNLLSTIFAPTKVLTFLLNPDNGQSQFCSVLRPPSPLPPLQNASNYCPLPPGPIAFTTATILPHSYQLMTLNTQVRVVDTSSPPQELACVQVPLTPLKPGPLNSIYGHAAIVFWLTVFLAIAFWLVVGAARLAAAWKRGRQRVHNNVWSHIQGLGFVLASAISGERFASSPALLRFGTPSMRDVIFHTQWCSLLAMVTVRWPPFVYPYFAQTAWANLLYNITLTQGSDSASKHWDPLHADVFNPPSNFADQFSDPNSLLFINTSIPNTFFSLPAGTSTGISALAAAVGIRHQDVFGVALGIFLLIIAGTLVLSFLIFAVDRIVGSIVRTTERRRGATSGTKTPPWSSGSNKEFAASPEPTGVDDEAGTGNVRFLHRPASRTFHTLPVRTGWLSHRLGQNSFHGSVLHGNLIRILMLFHLPVTIFSCYEFSLGSSRSSVAAVVLAAFAFAIFSVIVPVLLVVRLSMTPTNKLYDETGTLLALGPLYNHYAHGSQLFASLFFTSNIAYGITLGCGQQSGSAQAIIILVVEVVSALTTSVWLPWGRGAMMGGISFTLCVARIITAVLLVILSPIVDVGDDAAGWIAYAILFIQGLVYIGFLLMLVCKLLEGIVRFFWDVSFDRSRHSVDSGLLGVIGLAGCCGPRPARSRPRPVRTGSDATTQHMLPLPPAAASTSRTSVSGPPSVLRPEQLTQPYREDSDDEGGYILGAWHYDDDEPVASPAPSPSTPAAAATAPATGFSRIAGGRANIDAPYTMAAGASAPSLPPGAMAPAHVPARGRAPSAITLDASEAPETPAPQRGGRDVTSARARGRHWFGGFFGARETAPLLPEEPAAAAASSASAGTGGGSFVVIRERRPSPLSQMVTAGAEDGEDDEEAPRSFSVARPNRSQGLLRPGPSSASASSSQPQTSAPPRDRDGSS